MVDERSDCIWTITWYLDDHIVVGRSYMVTGRSYDVSSSIIWLLGDHMVAGQSYGIAWYTWYMVLLTDDHTLCTCM